MANPQDTGTFDSTIGARRPFTVVHPKSGDTGTFDTVVGSRLPFGIYVKAPATVATTPSHLMLLGVG